MAELSFAIDAGQLAASPTRHLLWDLALSTGVALSIERDAAERSYGVTIRGDDNRLRLFADLYESRSGQHLAPALRQRLLGQPRGPARIGRTLTRNERGVSSRRPAPEDARAEVERFARASTRGDKLRYVLALAKLDRSHFPDGSSRLAAQRALAFADELLEQPQTSAQERMLILTSKADVLFRFRPGG